VKLFKKIMIALFISSSCGMIIHQFIKINSEIDRIQNNLAVMKATEFLLERQIEDLEQKIWRKKVI
jgi:cell division protein FtsB